MRAQFSLHCPWTQCGSMPADISSLVGDGRIVQWDVARKRRRTTTTRRSTWCALDEGAIEKCDLRPHFSPCLAAPRKRWKHENHMTLVVNLDGKELAVGVTPVSSMLSMKCMAKAANARKAVMASQSDVVRSTGYVLGGVSPLGQKKSLRTFVDSSALSHAAIFVSAGRRGLEIELSPCDLQKLVDGEFVDLCQHA